MLVQYLIPIGVLVALQLVLNSWGEVEAAAAPTSTEVGEKDDLESAELFLRPVVIKYGHDHPGIYTWQGGSGVGMGWGMYKPKAMEATGGWPKEKKKAKKKKKEKKKKPKKKKKKKPKKKKPKKKKKEKKGGWGWSWGWIEEGGAGSDGYGSVEEEGGDEKEEKERRINVPAPTVPGNLKESIVARYGTLDPDWDDNDGDDYFEDNVYRYQLPQYVRNAYNF